MRCGLVGHTGFVGNNLKTQMEFESLFNRDNIYELGAEEYDCLICAAPSAKKWLANKEPEKDLQLVNGLIEDLKKARTKYFIQISTIDIYREPINVDENSPVEIDGLHPYGLHRYRLEEFVRNNFKRHLIMRLPALFGEGLKKNFIFDLLNNNCLDWTHKDSRFQFYYLKNLAKDIEIAKEYEIETLNVSTEPISAHEIAEYCLGIEFNNVTEKPPANYDIKSRYFDIFRGSNGYLYSRQTILDELKRYVLREKGIDD